MYFGTAAWYTLCSSLFGCTVIFGIYLFSACAGTVEHLATAAAYIGHFFTAAVYVGFGTIFLQIWGFLSTFLGLVQGPLTMALPAVAPALVPSATLLPLDKVIVAAIGALISAWSYCCSNQDYTSP